MDSTESAVAFGSVLYIISLSLFHGAHGTVSPLLGRVSTIDHYPVLALPAKALLVVVVGLVEGVSISRVLLLELLVTAGVTSGIRSRSSVGNHVAPVTTGRHVVALVAVLSLYVTVHKGMIFNVGVNFAHGPVGLTLGHPVDEVVLHKLVALNNSPGVLLRHHLESL